MKKTIRFKEECSGFIIGRLYIVEPAMFCGMSCLKAEDERGDARYLAYSLISDGVIEVVE